MLSPTIPRYFQIMKKQKRHTIDMTPAEVEALNRVATDVAATARAGATFGQPSWRALLKGIAEGWIKCRRGKRP